MRLPVRVRERHPVTRSAAPLLGRVNADEALARDPRRPARITVPEAGVVREDCLTMHTVDGAAGHPPTLSLIHI